MAIHTFPEKSAVIEALAERIEDIAQMSIHSKGSFSFVLSGGNTPKQLYETLAASPFRERIPWSKVDFFLGDERYVPITDNESNYKMIAESLLIPLNIKEEQVYYYDTTLSPRGAAARYQKILQRYFKNEKIVFDLVLLGLGENVHTASLFPQTDILHDNEPAVKSVHLPETDSYRISLNAPMINQSNHIIFLVTGLSKAMAVHQVIEGKLDLVSYPAQLIRTELTDWYIDEPAASYL